LCVGGSGAGARENGRGRDHAETGGPGEMSEASNRKRRRAGEDLPGPPPCSALSEIRRVLFYKRACTLSCSPCRAKSYTRLMDASARTLVPVHFPIAQV